MTRAALAAVVAQVVLALSAGPVCAQSDADQTFQTALATGDIDALERLGASRPLTRWSDDAWSEAAWLAIRRNDYARARRDLEQVIAISGELTSVGLATDPQLVRRARLELERLGGIAGAAGEWNAVAADHERLLPRLQGGDPQPALRALEQLVRQHPRYPRAAMLMVAIARGWERDGEPTRALGWLDQARKAATAPADRIRAHAELVRTLTRSREIEVASRELDALATSQSPALIATLRHELQRAELRRTLRTVMGIVLAALALLAVIALRRSAGSWRAAARRLFRPPMEVLFLLPVAAVLIVVAHTGNPMIARAVRTITIAGVIATWLSGAILEAAHDQKRTLRLRRVLVHAALAIMAVLAATYLAVDSGHLINFVIETWQAGHEVG